MKINPKTTEKVKNTFSELFESAMNVFCGSICEENDILYILFNKDETFLDLLEEKVAEFYKENKDKEYSYDDDGNIIETKPEEIDGEIWHGTPCEIIICKIVGYISFVRIIKEACKGSYIDPYQIKTSDSLGAASDALYYLYRLYIDNMVDGDIIMGDKSYPIYFELLDRMNDFDKICLKAYNKSIMDQYNVRVHLYEEYGKPTNEIETYSSEEYEIAADCLSIIDKYDNDAEKSSNYRFYRIRKKNKKLNQKKEETK